MRRYPTHEQDLMEEVREQGPAVQGLGSVVQLLVQLGTHQSDIQLQATVEWLQVIAQVSPVALRPWYADVLAFLLHCVGHSSAAVREVRMLRFLPELVSVDRSASPAAV